MSDNTHQLISIIGPTASGKTAFAVRLALVLDGEIISGDSRQVYQGMDVGTGKDLSDYAVNGTQIPYHLIDIRDAGEKYTLFHYQHDFHEAYRDIFSRGKTPLLCGGTGLYIESVLKGYRLLDVPENTPLRKRLEHKSLPELSEILNRYKTLHNTTDTDTKKRAIRAIEIADFQSRQNAEVRDYEAIDTLIIGIDIDREARREKISSRLKKRLDEGMIEEVKTLIANGVQPGDLIYYGLEYKFVTLYVVGEITFAEMFSQLETAIHQFAKRQMTWFRGMERRGFTIHWLDASLPMEEKIEKSLAWIRKSQ
ncbi:MAG: tRNA (adenosine(37)-N6)-dimethylallyltransferase MiaA [Dysgonamonadaceae bacterium]|nr:tRNA (adenosine(37)-N6)-dimethylallyltransferase MiaA [Dysgonamonadaceae bacterium]